MIAALDCNRWSCERCSQKMRRRWETNAQTRLREAEYVEELETDAVGWNSLRVRIWRHRGERLRFKRGDVTVSLKEKKEKRNCYIVLTTARVGGTEVPKNRVEARLQEILGHVPLEKGAITTSREWKLPSEQRGQGGWQYIGSAGTNAEKVLAEAGIEAYGSGRYIYFDLPDRIGRSWLRWIVFHLRLDGTI